MSKFKRGELVVESYSRSIGQIRTYEGFNIYVVRLTHDYELYHIRCYEFQLTSIGVILDTPATTQDLLFYNDADIQNILSI